ncbi:hypothetical protein J3R30DRAFT_3404415 [Lentinula aciculospora]|uniref:Uncharacterized protein n=1 Tax=Lentinula aciculospora TaxID=153920 RepID=A0A9W9DMU9_9AGAR|nr:hypothetical protein J3R30DRAFT_3404415 [Lentinula aciculospora]
MTVRRMFGQISGVSHEHPVQGTRNSDRKDYSQLTNIGGSDFIDGVSGIFKKDTNVIDAQEFEERGGISTLHGQVCPAILRVVRNSNPTVQVHRHLTAALGIPIAPRESESNSTQGSVGSFHENSDEQKNLSNNVYGASNHHVLPKNIRETCELKGALATSRDHGILAEFYAREITKLEKERKGDVEEEANEDAADLIFREKLDKEKQDIVAILDTDRVSSRFRNIVHVQYSPPIFVDADVEGKRYTEGWGMFELDEVNFKSQFNGDVVDLGKPRFLPNN